MSQQEFETYLELMGKMLRLTPEQRESIADEIRDHLEERLQELIDAGHTSEQAIQLALDDLGDASALARRFTDIAHQKRRRRLVRWTLGGVGTVACGLVAAALLWPGPSPMPQQIVVAQDAVSGMSEGTAAAVPVVLGPLEKLHRELETKLAEPLSAPLEFDNLPLSDVISFLQETWQIPFHIDRDARDMLQTSVTLTLNEGVVSRRTALDLLLRSGELENLGVVPRDGLLIVTSIAQALELRVYNCRDLIWPTTVSEAGISGGYGGAGMMAGGDMGGSTGAMAAMMMGGMGGGMGGMAAPAQLMAPEDRLVETIRNAVYSDLWDTGSATITAYNGLVVVRQTPQAHIEIARFLTMVRKASQEQQ